MSGTTIDTLELFEDFKQAFTEEQAQKLSKALKRTVEFRLDELANKRDIADLRKEMAEQGARVIKWVVGVAVAQTALIVTLLKLF